VDRATIRSAGAPAETPARPVTRPRLRLVLAALLVGGLVAVLVAARLWPHGFGDRIQLWLHAAQHWGRSSWLAFAAIQTLVALSGVVPASLVGIAAGAVFGIGGGFAIAAASTLLGAGLAFLMSRSVLRPLILGLLARRPLLGRLDKAVARDGWRTVCLLRVSPVMPFAVTSYALGLTGLRLRDYLLGTLASLPALLGYVVLGTLAQAGADAATSGASISRWAMLGGGILATGLLTLRLGRLLRAALAPGGVPDEIALETEE
jgi:uncharacterized membrane protein YdjX (TVP38/TMEM64 family)